MWILGLGGLRGMDLTRYRVYKSSDRTKTCCLLPSFQVKFTTIFILLRTPKRLKDNLLFTAVYLKKGSDNASLTFTVIFI